MSPSRATILAPCHTKRARRDSDRDATYTERRSCARGTDLADYLNTVEELDYRCARNRAASLMRLREEYDRERVAVQDREPGRAQMLAEAIVGIDVLLERLRAEEQRSL